MKARILQALYAAPPAYVSGSQLAAQLGISRAAVWKQIEALRREGYEIAAAPRKGYRLEQAPDVLSPSELSRRLTTAAMPFEFHCFDQVTSTNAEAARLAQAGAPEGTVVLAEAQTAGRGRLGRHWQSPAGTGLWLSVVLRPQLPPAACAGVTLVAGVAVAAAIAAVTGLRPGIKWPNDVLMDGKKVCGILTDIVAEWEQVDYLILGIGINVNDIADAFTGDLAATATSLRLSLGQTVSRQDLCVAVLVELAKRYPAFATDGFSACRQEWLDHNVTVGQSVVARSAVGAVAGLAVDVASDGALIIEQADGAGVRVTSGEVTLRSSSRLEG